MKLTTTFSLLLATGLLAACATGSKMPMVTEDGLEKIEVKNIDTVYWKPGAELADYSSVLIEKPEVSFRKNWLRDQNRNRVSLASRVTEEDVQRISSELGDAFVERFTQQLESGGYDVVSSAGPGVLVLQPEIVNLDVAAPDVSMREPGITRTFTVDTTGEMTLEMDMLDGASSDVIGRAIDRSESRNPSVLQVTNSVTNRADANMILDRWARALVDAMDTAHSR